MIFKEERIKQTTYYAKDLEMSEDGSESFLDW